MAGAQPEFGLQPEATRGYDPASQSIDPKALVLGQRYRAQLRREYVEPERQSLRDMYRDRFPGTLQAVIDASVASIGQPYEGDFVELIGADRTVPLFDNITGPNRHGPGLRMAFSPPERYFFFHPGKLNTLQLESEALGRQKLPPELAGKIGEFAGATDPYRGYKDSTTGTGTGVSVPRGGRRTRKSRRTRVRVSRTLRVRKTRRSRK